MVKVSEKPQISLFGEDARKRVQTRLKNWYHLTRTVERLKRQIMEAKVDLKRLDDLLIASHILNYEALDMPKGGQPADPVGERVANVEDKRWQMQLSITEKEFALVDAQQKLREIEDAVSELNPRDAEIVRFYYLNGYSWEWITAHKRISKSQLYRILDAALDVLGDRF